MFFRSKPKPEAAPVKVDTVATATPEPLISEVMTPSENSAPTPSPSVAPQAQTPDQKRRALAARRATVAFGKIIALMMRSAKHKQVTVQQLRELVAPIVMSGQFAIVGGRFQQGGFSRPLAAVLWARVSPEIDARLTADVSGPVALTQAEISSGTIVWIVDVLGDAKAIHSLIRRLSESQWQGQVVKLRTIDENQSFSNRTLGPY